MYVCMYVCIYYQRQNNQKTNRENTIRFKNTTSSYE
jgi:hypothetical protein